MHHLLLEHHILLKKRFISLINVKIIVNPLEQQDLMKKIVYFALQAAISIFLINLVFDEVSNHGLELEFADKFLLDFFQAIFLFLLGLLLQTWRLSFFVSMYNQKISKFLLFTAQYLGMFFSLVLPSSIGGDIVKVLILKNGLRGFTRATIPIVLDRVVGLLSITFFIPLYFLILKDFSFNLILLYLVSGILLMVVSVLFIFLLYQKFCKKYWSKWGQFLPSNVKFLDILIILIMSLVSQILIFCLDSNVDIPNNPSLADVTVFFHYFLRRCFDTIFEASTR